MLGAALLAGPLAFAGASRSDKISIFSKNLQWLPSEKLGAVVKQLGFDGVDLTVRPGGHIEPAKVATDLPALVKNLRTQGVEVYSLVTAIDDASPLAEEIIRVASSLGIRYYRLNWFPYDASLDIDKNLQEFRRRFERIANLNEKYNVHGAYQNHAGSVLGASIWDLYTVLKDLNPKYIGCQYDIRHACVEGFNSWINDFQRIAPYVHCYNIKDFRWVTTNGKWKEESVPLGSGTVDFAKFFRLLDQYQIAGPVSLHYEYALGGAENGAREISISEDQILDAMKKDLITLRSFMK